MRRVRPAAALLLATVFASPAASAAQGSKSAAVGAAVHKAMERAGIPGAAVEVVEHGRTIVHAAYGVQNIAGRKAVDPETRFEIGSITKQFTAAAILQLKEHGKLALTDRLGKYVPEYAIGKDVTIEQLLWQTSGLPSYTEAPNFATIAKTRPGSFAAIVALIDKTPMRFPAGTKWEYSNTNYVMLGRVVEVASGTSWEEYVRKNIFDVAGMTRSTFMEHEAQTTDFATGYTKQHGTLTVEPSFGHWATSAGAIVSTIGDMAKWDDALFGGKIVSEDDLTLMTTSGKLPNGSPTKYGFGWVIDEHDGQQRFWHNGGTFGFSASNQVYPALDTRIIVLENAGLTSADAVANSVFAVLHPDLANSETQVVAGEDPAVTARAREWMHRFQTGDIDRAQLSTTMNAQLTPALVAQTKQGFAPLGDPTSFVFRGKKTVGANAVYAYRVMFASGTAVTVTIALDEAGKISGYFVSGE